MKGIKKAYLKATIIVLICLVIITELALRFIWGFCDAVLMREDKNFEYIAIPQKRIRFGNHIFYNSFSQRNDEITEADSTIFSFFGDSVINGGTETDQDSLATTKLSKYLTNKYKKKIKILNISAGSWGPDNCFAYLQKYGDFKAKKIVLLVSSHDAYDDMTFDKIVGVNPSFPDRQYHFAIEELIGRYLIPRIFPSSVSSATNNLGINKKTDKTPFNTGFLNFYNYCKEKNIPFLIYLHAEQGERNFKEYNEQGQEIINFCKKNNISLIKELDYHLPRDIYRDNIHFNNLGQEKMFEILKDSLFLHS